MELFESEKLRNQLPKDGVVTYYGTILAGNSADSFLKILLEDIPWKNDEAIIFGKHIVTKRKVAWYGDSNYEYTYSNTTKKALAWTKELSVLKSLTEEITGTKFNSCLLNLYNNGEEGMAWHSDDEKALGKNSTIASLSFGAERKFYFKHKSTKEKISLILEHGSLLVMKGAQESWHHSLPKTKSIKQPRVNLTFRTMLY
ncbi:alpha-ketoglutarate-dependent dioxygenase AlkB [Leptospira venezuelensis]|uniref:alpha-ketoglutarate-dependent dioxygenase AlkB family protein n=1 Tax=Leptospira venezuelensis TaxID=1958811 RepID=UPI000A3886BD|nr:alpha-ketoglutarate-dependent dioxygenase AlkB [Leptospira venezuelensis]